MPLTDVFRVGPDGKVIPGWTVLRDPQTGQWFEVVSVMRAEWETPDRPAWHHSERSSLCVGRVHGVMWQE